MMMVMCGWLMYCAPPPRGLLGKFSFSLCSDESFRLTFAPLWRSDSTVNVIIAIYCAPEESLWFRICVHDNIIHGKIRFPDSTNRKWKSRRSLYSHIRAGATRNRDKVLMGHALEFRVFWFFFCNFREINSYRCSSPVLASYPYNGIDSA